MAAGIPHLACANLSEALAAGMPLATEDTPQLVCGSVYAAGEARRILMVRHGVSEPVF